MWGICLPYPNSRTGQRLPEVCQFNSPVRSRVFYHGFESAQIRALGVTLVVYIVDILILKLNAETRSVPVVHHAIGTVLEAGAMEITRNKKYRCMLRSDFPADGPLSRTVFKVHINVR